MAILLALALAVSCAGCGRLSLTEAELSELYEEEQTAAQSIGQELAATYAADQIFALNCVRSSSFNPYLTDSEWNKVVGMLVYETLVTQDDTFTAVPNLVTWWETEDGRVWDFYVDTSRTFHDGGHMTAADAAYSMQIAINYTSPYVTRFRHVNAVYSIAEDCFRVELGETNYRFYELLNIPCVEYNTGYSDMPPGTGPYAFSASGRYLTLDRNHPLAGELPIETIHLKEYTNGVDILQAFEDSFIDLVINDPNGMASLGYSSTDIVKYVNTSSMHYLAYNMNSGVFSNGDLRRIMTYAIDRATVVSDVMEGAALAATAPISPQSPLYPEQFARSLEYSDSGFRAALEALGAADTDEDGVLELNGRPLRISFVACSDSSVKVASARSIAKKLEDYGFDVTLRELGYDDYVDALDDGDFDVYYAEVRLCGDWDLRLLLSSSGGLNYGDVWDMQLDTLLYSALSSDSETRDESLETLYEYLGENAYITPICFEKSEVLYHRGVLSGLNPTQDNIFYDMQNWTVDIS